MSVVIENGKIIFTVDNIRCSFDAHGEAPRPSIMPTIIVGGKHLSSRSVDEKIEKYTAVQDVVIGNGIAAWYTQEFIPNGVDYKVGKKSAIYIGKFASGEEKLVYKGECYGDLCFDGNDLYFNTGNKVAVYHMLSDEVEILFKHSGIKKSDLELHITPKRIFYQHWTHSANNTMWYDRDTKEVVNPHFDGRPCFFIDDETILYQSLDHTWRYNVAIMRKKRFFNNKTEDSIIKTVASFFGVPAPYCDRYHSMFSNMYLDNLLDGRVYFKCDFNYSNRGLSFEDEMRECNRLGLPMSLHTFISCTVNSDDIRIEAEFKDIIRKEKPFSQHNRFDFFDVSLWTYDNENQ